MLRCKIIPPSPDARIEPWPWHDTRVGPDDQGGLPANSGADSEESRDSFEDSHRSMGESDSTAQPSLEEVMRCSYHEGYESGRLAAEQGLQHRFSDLAKAIVSIDNLHEKLRREAERDQVAIAIAVARRILHAEVQSDPNALRGLVTTAMEKMRPHKLIRVLTEPTMRGSLARALNDIPGGEEVVVAEDRALKPGTILFETSRGVLDASFDMQLSELESGLIDHLNRQ